MAKRNVEGEISALLDDFVASGKPLPTTVDGKVNVLALCRVLGLASSDAQHLHRKESLKTVINALAEDQGLLPIGARAQTDEDRAVESRIARVAAQAKDDAQAAAEQAAAAAAMLAELRLAQDELEKLRLENQALRARLQIIEDGGVPPRL
jgi:hypothetical protein